MTDIKTRIDEIIKQNNVVLFMKGKKNSPACGFSAVVSNILQNMGVEFLDINVLEDLELRQAIKEYSDWPTIPQLYIKGEFIGGCDIVREMAEDGELQGLLKEKQLIS